MHLYNSVILMYVYFLLVSMVWAQLINRNQAKSISPFDFRKYFNMEHVYKEESPKGLQIEGGLMGLRIILNYGLNIWVYKVFVECL